MNSKKIILLLALPILCAAGCVAQDDKKMIEGRWDMIISAEGKALPSWLEIKHSGTHTLIGRFVGPSGSARPISEVKFSDGKFSFAIPPQWESGNAYLDLEGKMVDNNLKGTILFTDGKTYPWTASRAPLLHRSAAPKWGKQMKLFNGKDLSGWHATGENQWVAEGEILKNPKPVSNLVTDGKFTDFKLHIEFRYPKDGNSGVYLRGRYELQIADNQGLEPSDIYFGGIYGFIEPNQMAAKSAGEWQTYDVTLIGRRVTIVANGIAIVNDQIIPGITGGALDSNEGEPGPIMLQGDHEQVEYRNIIITPAIEK